MGRQTGDTLQGQVLSRLARSWESFVGPGQSRIERWGMVAASAAGALAGAATPDPGARSRHRVALSIAATDLWGGAWVNNTPSCVRWYERPGQDSAAHLRFAGLHLLHAGAIAAVDSSTGGRSRDSAARWAAAHFGWMMISTAVITRVPVRARLPVAVLTSTVAIGLDRVAGPSRTAPWFAPIFYSKLLLGHAAGSIWNREPDKLIMTRSPAMTAAASRRSRRRGPT